MVAKMSLLFLAGAMAFAMTPMVAAAQGPSLDAPGHGPSAATQPEAQLETDSGSNLAALRLSAEYAALLAPPVAELPTQEGTGLDTETAHAAPAAPAKGSGSGLGFMIGGAAAFVGGLLIGGTGGTIIAAGGVGLGVYGAIIYF